MQQSQMSLVAPSEPDTEQSSKSTVNNGSSPKTEEIDGKPSLPKLNFPAKLHLILSTPEFNDTICWLSHGRAWRVQQQVQLETEILPKFFQHQKVASFYRQVTGWGFNRVTSGADFNAYYHELFLRDAPELCRRMKRPTRTELADRKENLSKTPPDFYAMPLVSEASNETFDPTYFSQQTSIDEYKNLLVRRLSTYSLTEKEMYLRLEANRLEKKRSGILEQLEEVGGSNPNPNASASASSTSVPSVISLQSVAREPQPRQHQQQYQRQRQSILNNLQPAMQVDPLQLALLRLVQPPVLQSPLQNMSPTELVNLLLGAQLGGSLGSSEQHPFNRLGG